MDDKVMYATKIKINLQGMNSEVFLVGNSELTFVVQSERCKMHGQLWELSPTQYTTKHC